MCIPRDYVAIFGYGSLVNPETRYPGTAARPFRIRDWRRGWRHCVERKNGKVCMLTISRHPKMEVAGALVRERRDNLASIDAREEKYRRLHLRGIGKQPVILSEPGEFVVFTYTSTPSAARLGSREF